MAGNDGKPRLHALSPSGRRRVGTLTRRNEKPLRRRPAATPPERRFSVISRHERCLSLSNQDRHEPAFAESPLEAPDRVLQEGLPACRLEPPKRWRSLARRADPAHVNPGLTAEGDRLCETRIDTNSCLLILEPGLLWPGFRKAPAARGSPRRLGSPLSTRRGPCGAPDRRGPAQNWKNMGSCQSWFNGDRRSS